MRKTVISLTSKRRMFMHHEKIEVTKAHGIYRIHKNVERKYKILNQRSIRAVDAKGRRNCNLQTV